MPCAARTCAVPPVDSSATPRAARPRANSTMPVLSETDSSACFTVAVTSYERRRAASYQLVLGELGTQRVAIEPQHLGRLRLVAVRPLEHRRQHGALDVRDHHVVDAMRWLAVEPAEIFVERPFDAPPDLVAVVESNIFFHAASASPIHAGDAAGRADAERASRRSPAAYGNRSHSPASRAKKRATACRCPVADSATFTSSRSAPAPGSAAVYQRRCLRAMRTPSSSP